jgi:hypothetical protein
VADERDHSARLRKARRLMEQNIHTSGPASSRLEQHPRNGRKRLCGDACGIVEPSAIIVIAFRYGHKRSSWRVRPFVISGGSSSALGANDLSACRINGSMFSESGDLT